MKKLLSIILAVAMLVLVFAGCGSAGVSSTNAVSDSAQGVNDAAPSVDAVVPEENEAPASDVSSEPAPQAEAVSTVEEGTTSPDHPATWLSDETVTLTMMWPWVGFYNTVGIEDMSQSIYYEELEKRLNVKLDLTLVGEEYQTAFMLMCAGGDLTDIIASADSNYSTGADACIEDDIILDLSDKIEEYAPDYFALLNNNPELKKQCTTDSGYVPSFRYVNDEAQTLRNLPVIRKDLLDQLGMDIPVTLEEAHDVLTAFKNEFQMDTPLLVDAVGTSTYIQTAFGPYGLYLDNGKAVYDFRTENFKNYISYMRQLVEEGIVNSDFVSMDVGADYRDFVTGGRSAIVNGMLYSDFNQYEENGIDLVAVPPVVEDASKKSEMGDIPVWAPSSNATSISTQCEEWEIAMAYFNYNYTEEGSFLANWGVEGKTFEYDDSGKPQYTEYVTNNPNIPQVLVLMYDCCWAVGYLLDTHNLDGTLSRDELEAREIYQSAFSGHSQTYPTDYITLTADESAEISTIQTDLDTFVEENIAHFIAGDTPLREFDSFVDSIYEKFDMELLESVYGDAYDRYMNR